MAGAGDDDKILIERVPGLDLYLNPAVIDAKDAERIRSILGEALAALDKRPPKLA